jgi:cytidylate kinase
MNHSSTYEKCLSYIDCHLHASKAPIRATREAPRPPAVTISRETGAGGLSVAERLAERLRGGQGAGECPWTVFDKNLVVKVLEDHQLPKRLAQFMPEDRVSYIADALEELLGLHPSSWKLIHQTAETILHLAELGNVILVGRGANMITRDLSHVLHVRLIGSMERRQERVEVRHKIQAAAARRFIAREDAARKRYVRKHFDQDIESPLLYHLVINTDWVTIDEAVSLIAGVLLERSGSVAPRSSAPG